MTLPVLGGLLSRPSIGLFFGTGSPTGRSRNLPHVAVVEPRQADPLSLVHYKKVLVTKAAVAQIEELLK